jgi:hypothetical protein
MMKVLLGFGSKAQTVPVKGIVVLLARPVGVAGGEAVKRDDFDRLEIDVRLYYIPRVKEKPLNVLLCGVKCGEDAKIPVEYEV